MGCLIGPSFLCSCPVGLLLCPVVAVAAVVDGEVVAVGGVGAGCDRSRLGLRRGVGEERVLTQRRYPCCCDVVVVAVAKAEKLMKFGRRNWRSFVGEIGPRSNNLESQFCEISDDVL